MNDLLRKTTDPHIWNHIRARTNNTWLCTKKRVKTIVRLPDNRGFSLNSSALSKYRQSKRFDGPKSIGGGGASVGGLSREVAEHRGFSCSNKHPPVYPYETTAYMTAKCVQMNFNVSSATKTKRYPRCMLYVNHQLSYAFMCTA